MTAQKYVNTDEEGVGEYADTPGRKSRVIGGTQSKAGAGRGEINPKSAAQSTEETEMLQEAQDAKAREKIKAMGYAKGGTTSGRSTGYRGYGIAKKV